MADGRYIFRNCSPTEVSIANVSPGEIIRREWTFRVNSPPEIQELLDSGVFDPRGIARGYNGELYDGDGVFLAEVNSWSAQLSINHTDEQPAGQKIVWGIPTGYTFTLTFTETIIKDARLLQKVIGGIADKKPDAVLNFMGVLRGQEG